MSHHCTWNGMTSVKPHARFWNWYLLVSDAVVSLSRADPCLSDVMEPSACYL